ncbi:MAG: VWA domain-containing protein [Phycisphaeraceae bacterium]|nr:VWA domain-containing protein [Phycisphaeraceae bacterium]
MSFLSPITGLIAAGITVPLLVLLYFLKLRRRPAAVSSTLLWRRAAEDLQANAPFQKLRRNLLLLLQLIVLAALAIALARPMRTGLAPQGQRMILVVDRSASMNATDGSPTRLDQARASARELVEAFDGPGGVMVIAVGRRAQVMTPFTTDRARLRAAVDAVAPTDEVSDLTDVAALIAPYVPTGDKAADTDSAGTLIYLLSDGLLDEKQVAATFPATDSFRWIALPLSESPAAPAAGVDHVSPANLAVVSFSLRRNDARPAETQVLTRLANFGDEPVSTNLSLAVDGRTRHARALTIAAGQTESITFDLLLSSSALLEVSHDHKDLLPADDRAALVVPPPRRLSVALVGQGNAFLQKAIEAVGVRQLVQMTPQRYESLTPSSLTRRAGGGVDEGYDLLVFDGYSPQAVPPVTSLYFAAVPPAPRLNLRGATDSTTQPTRRRVEPILTWLRDHPLLRYVALDDVLLLDPGRLELPDGAVVLANAAGGPVMAALPIDDRLHVITSFSPLQSNWPIQISFAVFMDNAVRYLGLGGQEEAALGCVPGQTLTIPVDPASLPGGATLIYRAGRTTIPAMPQPGRLLVGPAELVGLYHASPELPEPWSTLAVNLLDPAESDLRPRAVGLMRDPSASPAAPSAKLDLATHAAASSVQQETWRWFAAAALLVLVAEWLWYLRRLHV